MNFLVTVDAVFNLLEVIGRVVACFFVYMDGEIISHFSVVLIAHSSVPARHAMKAAADRSVRRTPGIFLFYSRNPFSFVPAGTGPLPSGTMAIASQPMALDSTTLPCSG